ncbi:MAG: phenylacetate--CoA ligase [Deltaproteobacteria bacterium]|nr:phenylacetate--CoA ligase [Deltaproteobacteria bacterium]
MAFIGDFTRLAESLRENRDHPLLRFLLGRSGMAAEDIQSYEDFIRITPFTKEELSRLQSENPPFGGLFDTATITKVFQSPGPIYNVKGAPWEHYRFNKALSMAGFVRGDVVLNTFSYHLSPAGEMFDEALQKIGALVVPLGPADSEKAAAIAAATGADGFIGTRSFLLKVLENLGEGGHLQKAYLIAEKLTEADRLLFAQKFNVAAFQGYGIAEVGLIATEDCRRDGLLVDTEALFVELLEPATGNPAAEGTLGEVVVTFFSPATPFLRLATGDLAAIHSSRPDCLAGIFGRADSSVKTKGVFIHFWQFETFCGQLETKAKLVVASDGQGMDRLVLKIPRALHERTVVASFKKIFGLTLSQVDVDDKIDSNEIEDQRTHLSKR